MQQVLNLARHHHHEQVQRHGYGEAHSKIILMGEHAVVYDEPAIAVPFKSVQVVSTITPAINGVSTLSCVYYSGDFDQVPEYLNNLKKCYALSIHKIKLELSKQANDSVEQLIDIRIESNIPQARGMGSSASVCVAFVKSLFDYYQVPLSNHLLRYIVNEAEVIAHGSTSGLDTLMTTSHQPVIYKKSQSPKAFDLNLDAILIVADSGLAGQTKMAVNSVAQLKNERPEFVVELIGQIGDFVKHAKHAIQTQDVKELGRLMTYNHYYLNQLGVSTPFIDHIVSAAWKSGALGAKLTGGGLGGCIIALAETKESAEAIAEAMTLAGAVQTWQMSLCKTL